MLRPDIAKNTFSDGIEGPTLYLVDNEMFGCCTQFHTKCLCFTSC